MSRYTFLLICEKLRPYISKESTQFRKAISIEKKVAVAIWCLATPFEYHTVAHLCNSKVNCVHCTS